MSKNLLFILLAIISFSCSERKEKIPSEKFLEGRIPTNERRYPTMLRAMQLMDERNAQVVVETGTSRGGTTNFEGDGGSTIIFGDWAYDRNRQFYSVDINPESVRGAKEALDPNNKNVTVVCQDSLEFLANFPHKIDFLYLDSFDYDLKNPTPSQEHHLKEVIAAYPHLTPQTVIMIDDCNAWYLPGGGKGGKAIPYLVGQGWKVINNNYQVILVREDSIPSN